MKMQKYLETIKDINKYFIEYIEKDDNYQKEEDLLIQLITDKKIEENKFILEEILETISQIATYHHQVNNFYEKIQSIILFFKESIKKGNINAMLKCGLILIKEYDELDKKYQGIQYIKFAAENGVKEAKDILTKLEKY